MNFYRSHKRKILTVVAVTGCLVVAGPELGLGLEMIALVELLGVELFLFAFIVPLWFYWFRIQAWFYKVDPYFFIPTLKQIRICPRLLAHAIPGHMVLLLWAASIFAFT